MTEFGLTTEELNVIIQAVKNEAPEIEEVWVFGSRAKGNFKQGSDVDLAIKGEVISVETVLHLSYFLENQTFLPYFFDIIDYQTISNPDLTAHIDRCGKLIFQKTN